MSLRYFRNGQATSLSTAVSAFDATIEVDQASGFPTQYPYTLIIDPDTLLEEVMDVTAATGTSLTVTRGADATTASAHAAGAIVYHGVSARDHAEANSHVNATTNIHGISGGFVDTDSDQSVSGDKTFTGLLATSGGAVVAVGGDQTIAGIKEFSGQLKTTAGGLVETLGGPQTVTGNKTWTGIEVHQGVETHSGTETHDGNATFNNPVTFTDTLTVGGADLTGPWVDYTPVRRDGSGGSTLGAGAGGANTGAYKVIGEKTCLFWARVFFGTAPAIGTTDYAITLPFAANATRWRAAGAAYLFDQSAGKEFLKTWRVAGSTATSRQEVFVFAEDGARVGGGGPGTPIAWAASDEIFVFGFFELA